MNKIEARKYNRILLGTYLCLFIWSGISPFNYKVWLLEMLGLLLMIAFYLYFNREIHFSKTLNTWFFIAAALITIGAHYSFPNVPFFKNLAEITGTERNNFDKIGHVVQGIIPVLLSWEVLIKNNVTDKVPWLQIISFCAALAVSAFYEIFEWLFIVILGDTSYTFEVLGTQGYVWDAQTDMLCAFIGAILTILFGKKHLLKIIEETSPIDN